MYEEKKQARIDRLEKRIGRLRQFAEGKDLSLFGESRSGIPLGQPILVGHHSERRHRKHLERINRIVRAGYDAAKKADQLESRLESMKNNNIIQVDNPDARELILKKIEGLELGNEKAKSLNKIMSKFKTIDDCIENCGNEEIIEMLKARKHWYASDSVRLHYYSTTGNSAEIRRLKSRLVDLEKIAAFEFEDIETEKVSFKLVDGQFQVRHAEKPEQEVINKLKSYPVSMKWSGYSKAWVRKQTATTNEYWIQEVKKVIL
jgi:hypothetical protein